MIRRTGNFKQTGKIMYEIRKNFTEIVPPINIGMVIGDDAIIMSEAAISQLDLAIDLIVKMIKDMGLSIEK